MPATAERPLTASTGEHAAQMGRIELGLSPETLGSG
jgi:hypothetical protein